ncbi:MAG: hypothetical protein HZLCBSQH_001305 [Candidatus Fervidibacterota bacterium]
MVPVRLWLRNFLSYGDEGEVLDLSRIHVAAIVGHNGAGKSSLIDAITWALFGKARSDLDGLVRKGAKGMEVALEFLMDGQLYRVRRSYSRARKDGHIVSLEQHDPLTGKWKPLVIKGGVRQAQTSIQKLLRMDYDTFVNTVCQLQGKSGEFMTLSPAQRRDLLAEVLRLGDYEKWAERAKGKVRELAGRIAQAEQEIAHLEWERQKRPQLEQALDDLQRRLQGAEEEQRRRQEERRHWQEEQKRLLVLETQRQNLQGAISDWLRQKGQAQERLKGHERERQQLQEILGQKGAIQKALEDYRRTQEEEKRFAEKQHQWAELQQRKNELEKRIGEEQAQLQRREGELMTERQRWEKEVAKKTVAQKELEQVEEALRRLDEWQRKAEEWRQERQQKTTELAALQARKDALRRQREEIGEKLRLLSEHEGEPKCPLCGNLLTPEDFLRLRQRLLQEEATLQKQMDGIDGQIKTLQGHIKKLDEFLRKAETELTKRPALEQRRGQLRQTLEDVARAERELARWQAKWQAFQGEKEQAEQKWQKERERLKTQETAIGYDPHRHEQLRQWLRQNESVLRQAQRLHDAEQRLPQVEEAIRREQSHLTEIERNIADAQQQIQQLDTQLRRRPEVDKRLQEAEQRLAEGEKVLRDLNAQRGEIEGQLKALERCEEDLKRWQEQLGRDKEAKEDYEMLEKAFGRYGIPGELLKVAAKWVEGEANRLLARLTKGRMFLRFELSRMTQKGSEEETLNIVIADELGDRPYEALSGGEKFRVDFALRLALAQLLARRSGAPLRTLVMDEGFGSQDKEGLEAMVQAIQTVAQDFDRVLVITHLDELRDQFPTLIEVTKDHKGSHCRLRERNGAMPEEPPLP